MSGMSVEELMSTYNFKHNSSIYKNLSFYDLERRINPKIIQDVNHDFFDEINEIQAYLLGFYVGDGNLSMVGNSYSINIEIAEEDRYIVDLYKKYISPNSNLKISTPKPFKSKNGKYYQGVNKIIIRITSSKIGKFLVELGYGANKTKLVKFIPLKFSDENKIHMLRGYFDADGCIIAKIRKEGWMNRRFQLTSYDRNILDEYVIFLKSKNINSKVYSEKNHFHLLVQKKSEIIKLYDLLYNNANFFLTRKEEKFKEVKKTPSDFREIKDSKSCNA